VGTLRGTRGMMLALVGAASLHSTADLGIAEGRCRPEETGPAVIATVEGLKDRTGILRAEVYPPEDDGFLADDNVLIGAGRIFRRTVEAVPPRGAPTLCVRLPAPGSYTLAVIHDRDGNRKFNLSSDGIGFANNPAIHLSKPRAEAARFFAGSGITHLTVTLNYRTGLFSFGPLRKPAR